VVKRGFEFLMGGGEEGDDVGDVLLLFGSGGTM